MPGRGSGCRSRYRTAGSGRVSTALVSSTMASAVAGSPGPLDRNTPSTPSERICSMVVGRRQHVGADAAGGKHPRRVRLDAEVDRGDREVLLAVRRHPVPGLGGDLAGQVGTGHRRLRARPGPPCVAVTSGSPTARAGEDAAAHRAARYAAAGSARGCRRPGSRPCPDAPSPPAGTRSPASSTAAATGRGPRSRRPRSRRTRCPTAPSRPGVRSSPGDPAGVADLRRGGHHHLAAVATGRSASPGSRSSRW